MLTAFLGSNNQINIIKRKEDKRVKIEMGESLFYSWLRHVKDCKIVQMNWKSSPSWQLQNEESLEEFMNITGKHFLDKYGYAIYNPSNNKG